MTLAEMTRRIKSLEERIVELEAAPKIHCHSQPIMRPSLPPNPPWTVTCRGMPWTLGDIDPPRLSGEVFDAEIVG